MPITDNTRARMSSGKLALNIATAALHPARISTHKSIEPS